MKPLALLTLTIAMVVFVSARRAGTSHESSPPIAEPTASTGAAQAAKKKPAAAFDDYQVPAGSPLTLRLRSTVASASTRAGEQIRAELPEALNRDGIELIPAGSLVHGKVVDVVTASERQPRGRLTLAFYVIEHARTRSRASIQTHPLVFEAPTFDDVQSRSSKKKPADVRMASGDALSVILVKPLTVRIPR